MTLKEKIVLLIDYAKLITGILQYAKGKGSFSPSTTKDSAFAHESINYVPLLDCANVTSLARLCRSNSNVKTIRLKNTQNVTTISSAFYYCHSLETLETLDLSSCGTYSSAFSQCYALKNLRIVPNTIKHTINISQAENLTAESAKSVILGLMNYAGTDKELGFYVTFHGNVWALLDAEGNTAPHGGTWRNYVTEVVKWNV